MLDKESADARLEVAAWLINYSPATHIGFRLGVKLLDPAGAVVLEKNEAAGPALAGRAERSWSLAEPVSAPAKWTAETPVLYTLVCTLTAPDGSVAEVAAVRVGFRQVEIRNRQLWINGVPVKLNGKAMDGVSLIKKIAKIAGDAGVGRSDMIENRLVGIKSREIYEAPAAWTLNAAHKALESLVLDRETVH